MARKTRPPKVRNVWRGTRWWAAALLRAQPRLATSTNGRAAALRWHG